MIIRDGKCHLAYQADQGDRQFRCVFADFHLVAVTGHGDVVALLVETGHGGKGYAFVGRKRSSFDSLDHFLRVCQTP